MQRIDQRMAGAHATLRADARASAQRERTDDASFAVLHPLRPLRGTQPLDLGFDLFRVQARMLVPIATALYLPIQLVDLALRLGTHDSSGASLLTTSGVQLAGTAEMRGYEPFILMAQSVALSLLGICCGLITAAMIDRRRPSLGAVLGGGLKRVWVSVSIVVISALIHLVSACVPIIGWLFAGAFTFMASVIAGAERAGPIKAFKRNIALARTNMMSAVGLFLGGLVLLSIARFVLLAGPVALIGLLGAPSVLIEALASASAVLLVIVQPLTATLAAGAYVSFLTRSEGLDLRGRIASLHAEAPAGAR